MMISDLEAIEPNPSLRAVAKYNTEQNQKHGCPQECDGFCAPDECVCPVDDEEERDD